MYILSSENRNSMRFNKQKGRIGREVVTVLIFVITIGATIAAAVGIFSTGGPGSFEYESIRGETVTIYGKGIYRHMSAEVAPQGIAQDYVTLILAVPALLFSFFWSRSGSAKGRLLLAGTLGYFLVTYLFYLTMAMYNALFLLYCLLLGCSFFALAITLLSFDTKSLADQFTEGLSTKWAGGFLIFNSVMIALLWLSMVVPPLLDGTMIPPETEHYTTLIVQGLDLGLLLPLGFVSGLLFVKKRAMGYLMAPVYLVFLCLLMTALSAKIIAMGRAGYEIIPAVFIIPAFLLASIVLTIPVFRSIRDT